MASLLERHAKDIRRLTGNFNAELGNDFNTRIQGTRIRHHIGPTSIKMYDKFGRVLPIETTTNDVSFFKHHGLKLREFFVLPQLASPATSHAFSS